MMNKQKRVVFTGGPSGGKTSIIEIVQRHFVKKVSVVPEAATILYGGGFPRKPGPDAMRHIQRAIYYVVRELEDLSADTSGLPVAVCDRGTIDNLAYWPEGGEGLFESVGSSREAELARYDIVVHLRSPSAAYAYQNSNTRIESHRQALELDRRIENVWKGHPKRFVVEENPDFLQKVNRVMEILETELPKLGV